MSKMMKMAMLNQSRKNNNRNNSEYSGSQIGFQYDGRQRNTYYPEYDNDRYRNAYYPEYNDNRYRNTYYPEYDRQTEYDRRMESEPIWNNRRRRNDNGQYMSYADNGTMHYGEKQYDENSNVVPMQGYLGIAYTMENGFSKMDKKQAENWTKHMKNEDGSTGARWTFDEIQKVMQQYHIDCNPVEFYATMNMLYSDYGKVFKNHDVATVQFYVDMAKAFLEDEDAVKDKLEQYYRYVVKH